MTTKKVYIMSKKIEALTPDQEAQLAVYRDKWLNIGLSTAPIDMETAIESVKLAITSARKISNTKIHMPTDFVRAASPVEALKIGREYNPKLKTSEFMSNTLWGFHDSDWISFYDYMQVELGVKNLESIDGHRQMAMNCGWVTILGDLCIIQDRPVAVHFDENRRAHNEKGGAIEYSDGYNVMMWHGTRIPRSWITEGLSATEALSQQNMELRRAACEIVGWINVLESLDYTVVDADPDPILGGTLVEVDLADEDDDKKSRFVMVRCGTGRDFAIRVPPETMTALEGVAWSYNMTPEQYMPEVRT
jgi:hypothetical protein